LTILKAEIKYSSFIFCETKDLIHVSTFIFLIYKDPERVES